MDLNRSRPKLSWRVFIILAVIAGAIFLLDRTGALLGMITDPVATVVDATDVRVDAIADSLAAPGSLEEAQAELDALQFRMGQLERENEELRVIEGEYLQLLQLYNRTLETPQLERVLTYVIGRGVNPLFHDVIIDRGINDGVRVGMAVESARGLVGQVYRTTQNSAQVVLITDSISRVPARLGESRATGLLRGGGTGGLLIMDWVDLEAQIALGDIVVTSGLEDDSPEQVAANRFPPGIVIGKVIEVERNEAELFQRAIVQPAADLDALEIAFVITDFDAADTSVFDETDSAE